MTVRSTVLARRRQILGFDGKPWIFLPLVIMFALSLRADDKVNVPADAASTRAGTDQVALVNPAPIMRLAHKPFTTEVTDRAPAIATSGSPIERANRMIADCQARYQSIEDYTCTFFKRERIEGRTTPLYIMLMKVRTKPQSIYFKFERPARGREAIFIAGRHGNKVLAHDVGFNKILAGTVQLEPTSSRAMEDCRHPITEAGIGPLLETLAKRWAVELGPDESKVTFHDDMMIGSARCTMIESTHPHRRPAFLHHKVRVFIDQELGLPIRFEAYDWPRHHKAEPELVEEYSYMQLKLNVHLRDIDFDTANAEYSFGRF
jgi:hypothetical protein